MLDLVACTAMAEWDRLLAGVPRASVFHGSDWLALIGRISGAALHPFFLAHEGIPVGVLPLFVFRRGPFRIVASPPAQAAAPYLGPAVPEDLLGEAVAAIPAAAKRLRASYLEVRLERAVGDDVLRAARLQPEPRSTYVLDLRPGPEALWRERLTSTCRRAVRKAQAAQVSVQEGRLADMLDRYVALAVGVYAKSNRPPPLSRDDYEAIAALQDRGGRVKVFAARVGGVLAAAGIFPFDAECVYYLDGVSDPAEQQARPNNLLHWEVIAWAAGAGLARYDMVGAGIPGVARFKQGFGPAEVPYTYAHRSLTLAAGAARGAYALLAPPARALQFAWGRVRARRRP